MLMPRHDILGVQASGPSSRRIGIIGSVAMLHVVIVYALISGMASHIARYVPPSLIAHIIPQAPSNPTPPPPMPHIVQPALPTQANVPVPQIAVATDNPSPISAQTAPTTTSPPDASATGLTNTHTVPPYPAQARAAGHQGVVVLQLVISAQGDVTSATVVQSSGFAELDAAAVSWVQAHWRYNPATQDGTPVPSQTRAAVKFDLKQGRG